MNLRDKFSPPPQARKHARALLAEELEERVLLFGDSMDLALEVLLTPGQPTELAGTLGDESYADLDVDFFAVDLTGGEVLTADVDAQALDDGGWLSDVDSYLRLFDSGGTELAANNDAADPDSGQTSVDAALVFTAPQTDTYYLGLSLFPNTDYDPWSEFSGYNGGGLPGDYVLQLTTDGVTSDRTVTGSLVVPPSEKVRLLP